MKKTLLCLTLAGLLSACGGSDNDSGSSAPPPSSSLKTGILTDGPVSGATYTINGVSKRTNAQGEFEYQEGDEITFHIGNIEIGTVTGADRITPVELADDVTTRTNLLIFLQSLDSEGDHDDGIQIPDSVSQLPANSIDFSKPTTEFITSFQPVLQTIEVFKDKVVVSATEAQANFNKTLLKDIVGVWYAKNAESEIVLQVTSDGKYLIGEPIVSSPSDSANGMEYGELSVNAVAGDLWAQSSIDTNEDWGLTDSGKTRDMKISFDGTQLKISEAQNPNESATFTKVPQNNSSIAGAWNSSSGKQLFVFNPDNNTYIMVDAVGDDQVEVGETPCGGPGIEYGKYRVQDGKLFVDNVLIDTNGCAGLSDNSASSSSGLPVTVNTTSLTLHEPNEGTFILTRPNIEGTTTSSASQFYKDIAGTWEIGRTNTSAVVLHILPTGQYAIGEADEADVTGQPGIEIGRLNWNALTSALSPEISVDTNDDYGLSHPDNDGHYRLSYNGTDLVLTDVGSNSTYILTKVKQSSGLVGTWQFNQTHLFAFFDTGFYFLLDTEGDNDCATPGIEYGKYSTTANTLAVTANLFDTNGCGGLHDSTNSNMINATYSISGTSLTLHPQGEDPVTFQRSK
ncbi:hypothetical protein [Acinetobacter indicus]|uniref:hypothetical protein n=1 Tax=Acinetobacter indicus TaxID=756892 RepID=UPI001D17FDD7|nr:hypothetical protein [Acinetobacter indicus]